MLQAGLAFFPHDTKVDEKIELIECSYGLNGYAIIFKLFEAIYSNNGYYMKWNEDIAKLWTKKLDLRDINLVSNVVKKALKIGLFDEEIYTEHSILTSHGIQLRYVESSRRRKRIEIKKDYCLLDVTEMQQNVYMMYTPCNKNDTTCNANDTTCVHDVPKINKEINKINKEINKVDEGKKINNKNKENTEAEFWEECKRRGIV